MRDKIPQAMVVAASAVVPADCPPASPLVDLLQRLLPEQCASATAAKRLLRRRLVLLVPAAAAAATSPAATTATSTEGAPAPAQPATATGAGSSCPAGHSAAEGSPAGAQAAASATPAAAPTGPSGSIPAPLHPRGLVALIEQRAGPGDELQVLARCGSGTLGWSGVALHVPHVRGAADPAGPGEAAVEPGAAARVEGGGGAEAAAAGAGAATAAAGAAGNSAAVGRRAAGGGGGGSCAAGGAPPPPSLSLPGLPVAYEDDHLAVVIKPPGLATQGAGARSAQGRLKYCLRPTPLVGALNRPQQAHRLDAPTGGLLLVAKTHLALTRLTLDLHERRVGKRYCALVKGARQPYGTIRMHLSGKPCLTTFATVPLAPAAAADPDAAELQGQPQHPPNPPPASGAAAAAAPQGAPPLWPEARTAAAQWPPSPLGPAAAAADVGPQLPPPPPPHHLPSPTHGALSKVLLWPRTGRTHQLRKHMAYTGTAILGDARYRGVGVHAGGTARRQGGPGDEDADAGGGGGGSDAASEGGSEEAGGAERGDGGGEEVEEEAGPSPRGASANGEAAGEGDEEAREVVRPPVQRGWALAAAEAAASGAHGGDRLSDGSAVSLCLWAVGLRFRHPASGRRVEVDIGGWADEVYDTVLQREAAAAAAAAAVGCVAVDA